MAKPKRGRPPKNKKAIKKDQAEQEEGLKRSVLKEILAIILITVGGFIILASIGVAGSLGKWVTDAIKFLVGQSIYVVPVALFGISYMLFAQEKHPLKTHNLVGILSFFICFSTILQALLGPEVGFDMSTVGNYGGVIGWGIYALVSPILTRWVLVFIFAMLTIISIIVAANARMKHIVQKLLPGRKDKEEKVAEVDEGFKINNALPIKGTIGNEKPKEEEKEPTGPIVATKDKDWKYPPLDLLEKTTMQGDPGDAKKNGAKIKEVFADFGYEVKMDGVDVGPTVSQYTLKPPTGVNLAKFNNLDKNLAYALGAEQVRIEAPIPGRSLVGLEVPNKTRAVVRLKDILNDPEVSKIKSKLNFVLGRDVGGQIMTTDLDTAPHLLIAGSTNTGKSVMIHTLLVSLLYRNSPSELKLIMIDPKRADFSLYDNLPHLLCPIINEPDQAISSLKWATAEMERRLKLLQENKALNIAEYNAKAKEGKMPYIVIVIDELANLMDKARKDMESLISTLAAKARAAGLHLVLATQTPRVNVITGTIKNNVPVRIAFTVPQRVDSQTIIDASGAEKLLGKGDMLFYSPSYIQPKRAQGVLVTNDEVTKVVKYLKEQREPQYNEEVLSQAGKMRTGVGGGGGFGDDEDDEMLESAAELVIQNGKASATLLQRRLRVGYPKAARLIDLLEDKGVIGPADGSRPREVLISSVDELRGGNSESE
jgi:S-DNA-T family DNA segregation ATPase FtsK/SpoIIIE